MEHKKSKLTTILILVVVILLTIFLWMLGGKRIGNSSPVNQKQAIKE